MPTEDELPEELDKLEITPLLPQAKLLDNNLPVQLNPFFENLKDTVPQSKVELTIGITDGIQPFQSLNTHSTRINTHSCRRCRSRRASESLLDELKHTLEKSAFDSAICTRTPPNGGLKQTLKKATSSSAGGLGKRKSLLREPVLKAFHTCLHPHRNVRRKLLAPGAAVTATIVGKDGPLTAKGMSDFRDLINECRALLGDDVDFTGKINQISLNNHKSKNFTTIQTSKTQSTKFRHSRRRIPNTAPISAPSPETAVDANAVPLLPPPLIGSSITSTIPQQRNYNLSPEHALNHGRCSTTCSQQAGNSAGAATCDDVTIDELASYFDTFVHIPKKMSSMAEMMYI